MAELTPGDPQYSELRLIRAIAWRSAGRLHEAEKELADLEVSCQQGAARLLTYVKLEQARVQFIVGNLVQAEQLIRMVLRSGYSSMDPLLDGDARFLLGRILAMHGETWKAESELTQALEVFEEQGDAWRHAEAKSALAMVLVRQGRNFDGIRLWHESLAFYESEGHTAAVMRELERIGFATWCVGDLEQTRRTLHRVLHTHEENAAGTPTRSLLVTHYNLAGLELLDGNAEHAMEHLSTALGLALKLEDRMLFAGTKLIEAALALITDQPKAAATACAAAVEAADAISYNFPLCEQPILALAHCAGGDLAGGREAWPALPPNGLDGAQRMSLRSVRKVLRALLERAETAGEVEQYTLWEAELTNLIGE